MYKRSRASITKRNGILIHTTLIPYPYQDGKYAVIKLCRHTQKQTQTKIYFYNSFLITFPLPLALPSVSPPSSFELSLFRFQGSSTHNIQYNKTEANKNPNEWVHVPFIIEKGKRDTRCVFIFIYVCETSEHESQTTKNCFFFSLSSLSRQRITRERTHQEGH